MSTIFWLGSTFFFNLRSANDDKSFVGLNLFGESTWTGVSAIMFSDLQVPYYHRIADDYGQCLNNHLVIY
jgi:hypothetical protein